jgi:acyl-CoA thioester hydrolase
MKVMGLRIDTSKFARTDWPLSRRVHLRMSDVDTMGHVNNAAMVALLQEAWIAFIDALWSDALIAERLRFLIRALTVEYAAEVRYPGAVDIDSATFEIRRSSFTIALLVRQEGRPCVFALASVVLTGREGATEIGPVLRKILEERAV